MDNKEAKLATKTEFLNAVVSNNFSFTAFIPHQGSVQKDKKCIGRNSQFWWFHRKKNIKHQKCNELFIKNKIDFSVLAISRKKDMTENDIIKKKKKAEGTVVY